MDSLAAAPGTGPATSPFPVIRPVRVARTFGDLPTDRAVVMGILNVTPDSFSDGGQYAGTDDAISHGLRMHYGGADIIDVGGESTRPHARQVPVEEELARVLPVVRALVKAGALVSIDTMHVETARQALDAGAAIVNDISGAGYDPEMPALVAEWNAPYILTHRRGTASTMDSLAEYDDVVTDVVEELSGLRDRFVAAGVAAERIILDPGLGFAKTEEHNWAILRNFGVFTGLGHRVLVGASRKRFLGTLLTSAGKVAAPVERDHASLAVATLVAASGAWGVRVHDPAATLDAVKVAAATGTRA